MQVVGLDQILFFQITCFYLLLEGDGDNIAIAAPPDVLIPSQSLQR